MSGLARAAGVLAGWKGYAAAAGVALVVGAGSAWVAQGWRYGAEIPGMRAGESDRVADAQRQAREILQGRYAEAGQINERNAKAEWAAYGGLRNGQIEDDGLGLIAGRQRLHVRAAYPAAGGGVPEAGAGARMGDRVRAELVPAARSDYFALRAGIRQLTAQLETCQARLR